MTDQQQIVTAMSLPLSSNIKNYSNGIGKQPIIQKDKNQANENKLELRKKQVELITSSFLIGYNQIRELSGISQSIDMVMFDCFERLQWLDLQHNYLTNVSEELNVFKNLKTLYLHANYIPSIKEFTNLKELKQLRNLTVHGNPLVRIPNFRLYFIIIFPNLKKLDTVLVSGKERDNARVLFSEFKFKNFPVYTHEDLPLPPTNKEGNGTKED